MNTSIKRLQGDAQTVLSLFEEIEKEEAVEVILFKLRQIVGKCDYISSTIELEFMRGKE